MPQSIFVENPAKSGSEWAKEIFPPSAIAAKIAEVRKHLEFLERKEINDEGVA